MVSKIILIDNFSLDIVFEKEDIKTINRAIDSIQKSGLFSNIQHFRNNIKIVEEQELNYQQVSDVIELLYVYSFLQNKELAFDVLNSAWQLLNTTKNILCGNKKQLNYEIKVFNDSVISLVPLNTCYSDINTDYTKQFLQRLSKANIAYSLNINIINLFISSKSWHDIIHHLIKILLEADIMDKQDQYLVYNKIMLELFKVVAKDEINHLYEISTKSINHPLSQYKSIAESLEALLHKVVYEIPISITELNKLKSAIFRTGEFTTLPEVIIRNLSKFPQDIDKALEQILATGH